VRYSMNQWSYTEKPYYNFLIPEDNIFPPK